MASMTMAIVIFVPGAFGRRLALLQRRIEGEGRGRLPPHIPLLGPFEAAPPLLPLEQHCWEVCHRIAPFPVELSPPAVDEERRLVGCEVVSGEGQLVELRQALLARPEAFVGALTEKLLVYGLGRGLSHHDMPAVRGIIRAAAATDYRFSSIVLGIVGSMPFQMREASSD